MKTLPTALLLILPALAVADVDNSALRTEQDVAPGASEPGAAPEETDEQSITWMDSGHAYATDQAQALTEWMDGFFGDPNYDIEKPESLMRLEWENEWDEEDDHKSRVRLRGKIRLPRLSERMNLVFSGEDGDDLDSEERRSEDRVGLLYNVGERKRSRLDLTLGVDWGELQPGIRYRNQGPIVDRFRYRYTQHLEWDDDDGWQTQGQVNLDHAVAENQLVRWSNRAEYGEETDGVEWRTKLSFRERFETRINHDPFVVSYFGSVKGVTDPSYIKNYRVGMQFRRQVWRRYFFAELEPSYNFRKREGADREGVWNVVVRFEILFEPARRRTPDILAAESEADPEYVAGGE